MTTSRWHLARTHAHVADDAVEGVTAALGGVRRSTLRVWAACGTATGGTATRGALQPTPQQHDQRSNDDGDGGARDGDEANGKTPGVAAHPRLRRCGRVAGRRLCTRSVAREIAAVDALLVSIKKTIFAARRRQQHANVRGVHQHKRRRARVTRVTRVAYVTRARAGSDGTHAMATARGVRRRVRGTHDTQEGAVAAAAAGTVLRIARLADLALAIAAHCTHTEQNTASLVRLAQQRSESIVPRPFPILTRHDNNPDDDDDDSHVKR